MSTTTTSASSLSAIPCATVAPTLPPPTTVTFVFIESLFRCDICGRIIIQGRGTRDEGTGRAFVPRPSSLFPASPMLADFCRTANAIAATTKKSEKERLLADYLVSLDDASLERAVVFFSGSAFPRKDQRTVGVGGAALTEALVEVTGRTPDEVWAAWSKYGDAGDTVAELFEYDPARSVTLAEVGETFERLAATSAPSEKKNVLVALLRKLDAQGVRFVVKILLREFRIGLQEGLVESAIAKAFDRPLPAVRRANMLTGDIGAAALLARSDALDSARMNLFHPFAFMLAQPEEDPDEIVAMLGAGAFADDKYDGVRAQIHASADDVRIYSRTLDDVTHRFPELESAARKLGHSA